jgi:hypothetical protein
MVQLKGNVNSAECDGIKNEKRDKNGERKKWKTIKKNSL